ncbi:MAG: hypothetical protein ACFFA1_06270 [Promethearchaeota archaeon]
MPSNTSIVVAGTACLGALVVLSELFPIIGITDIPFPPYGRLTFDPTGIPIILALLLFGFVSGVATSLLAFLIISLRGNIIGGVMKGLAEGLTVIGFALSYKLTKKLWVGPIGGIALRVAGMHLVNWILLPIFYGIPEPVVLGLLPLIDLFNLIQGGINVALALIISDIIPKELKPKFILKTDQKSRSINYLCRSPHLEKIFLEEQTTSRKRSFR